MNASGGTPVHLFDNGSAPAWSPDGTKIVFNSSLGITVMNADGSNPTGLTSGSLADWQPIPINAYPRPAGAYPMRASLVPAYEPCTSPNRTHGPPLGFGSCNPPAQEPGQLTVGTPDANGQGAKSLGSLRVITLTGNPATTADEADVRVLANITDVRMRSDLSDYTGDLEARFTIQITDKNNTPHPGGPGAATVQALTHSHPIPCAGTANTTRRLHLPARHHRRGPAAGSGGREAARDLGAGRDPRPRRRRQPVPDAGTVRPLVTGPGRPACAGSPSSIGVVRQPSSVCAFVESGAAFQVKKYSWPRESSGGLPINRDSPSLPAASARAAGIGSVGGTQPRPATRTTVLARSRSGM